MTDGLLPIRKKKRKLGCLPIAGITIGGLAVLVVIISAFADKAPDTDTTSTAASRPGGPNYDTREGQLYGYTAAADDTATGAVNNEVVMFRYRGIIDGRYTIETAKRGALVTSSCAAPCDLVTISEYRPYYGTTTERYRLDPRSIVALALDDAMHGRLQVWQEESPRPASPQPSADSKASPETEDAEPSEAPAATAPPSAPNADKPTSSESEALY